MADKGFVHWHTASPLCDCGLKVGTVIPETQQRSGSLQSFMCPRLSLERGKNKGPGPTADLTH